MPERRTTVVRDAATVLLVRDEPRFEVLMLRRSLASVFVAGAHVFPGGAVDPADAHPAVAARCAGRTDEEASELLGIERGGLAFFVAAVREAFEEAGVLLARHAGDGRPLDLSDPSVAERFARYRHAVDLGERTLAEILDEEDLVLDVGALHYLSHWITPSGAPRRYDTRFLVAHAPPGQAAAADQRETVGHVWVDPGLALEQFEAGEIELILPTLRSLETIRRFATATELVEAVASAVDPVGRAVTVGEDGGRRVALPGDPEPGPTHEPVALAGGSHE